MNRVFRRALVAALALLLALPAVLPGASALVYGSIDRYEDHSVKIWEDGSAFMTAGRKVRFVMTRVEDGETHKLAVKAFSSSKPAVASVNAKGWVKALKAGTAKILLKAKDGSQYAMRLTVVKSNAPKRVYFDQDSVTAYVGRKLKLATHLRAKPVTGLLALNKVTWKSSNKNVAAVDKLGTLTPKKAGACKITATCGKLKATLIVTVKKSKLKWL